MSVIDTFIAGELPQPLHVLAPNVIGKQAVVTDAMKAPRQHVDEEAPYKLIDRQGQSLVPITPFAAIVLPLEGNTVLIAGDPTFAIRGQNTTGHDAVNVRMVG